MRANQMPSRRHNEEFKAQVLAAYGERVAPRFLPWCCHSGSTRTLCAGGAAAERTRRVGPATPEAASESSPQFVPLALPAPPSPPPALVAAPAAVDAIRTEIRRGALVVSVTWPASAAGECAAWLRELLR